MDVSIIIVNYNVREFIVSCIESIYKHSTGKIKFEIIVVDNNSVDGSSKKISQNFPNVKIIQNEKNYGFSKGCNQGASFSKGDFILFLNPDTVFIEDSLTKFIKFFNNNLNIGALGPALLNRDGSVQQSFWRYPTLFNTLLSVFFLDFLNKKKNYKAKKIDDFTRVETLSGAAIFMKTNIFKDVNGFNENLFWMEDIDLCKRLSENFYLVYYLPKNEIIHFSGKSSEQNYKIKISNQLMSKIKYFRIHHSILATIFLYISILCSTLIKILVLFPIIIFSNTFKERFLGYLYSLNLILFFDWQHNHFSHKDL